MNTNLINAIKDNTNYGYTENGAVKHLTTQSDLLDMFAMGGAYRNRSDADCILLFKNALEENEAYAMKCLFYLRDVRGGGQGERRFFRVAMHWLAKAYPEIAHRNLANIAEYGRWDDLYCFVDTPIEDEMFAFIRKQLNLDLTCKTPSLLAKWLKSENTSSAESRRLGAKTRNALHLTPKQYRKVLSALRARINVLETLMSAGRWDEIEFDKIPSKAGLKYKNAFARHDLEREQADKQSYQNFIKSEDTKVNADALYPVDIAHQIFKYYEFSRYSWYADRKASELDREVWQKYWDALPDYYHGRQENGLAMVDVSGSMEGTPMEAAVSLGAYIAERGKGPFQNHFITFSSKPQLVKFEGVDIYEKLQRARSADWGMNTNISAALDLVLQSAVDHDVAQKDMPNVLYIFSDMEFDACVTDGSSYHRVGSNAGMNTLLERHAQKWLRAGYELPRVVFWNLNARTKNIPALGGRFSYVSGFSPVMIEQILSGKDGYALMMEKLNTPRYAAIH